MAKKKPVPPANGVRSTAGGNGPTGGNGALSRIFRNRRKSRPNVPKGGGPIYVDDLYKHAESPPAPVGRVRRKTSSGSVTSVVEERAIPCKRKAARGDHELVDATTSNYDHDDDGKKVQQQAAAAAELEDVDLKAELFIANFYKRMRQEEEMLAPHPSAPKAEDCKKGISRSLISEDSKDRHTKSTISRMGISHLQASPGPVHGASSSVTPDHMDEDEIPLDNTGDGALVASAPSWRQLDAHLKSDFPRDQPVTSFEFVEGMSHFVHFLNDFHSTVRDGFHHLNLRMDQADARIEKMKKTY